jgi:adhesin HecA-like repeat protein
VTTVGGLSIAADQNQAYQGALSDCVNKGGHQCVVEAVQQNGCAAAASNDFGEMVGGTDTTLRKAGDNARGKLQNQQGARIVAAGCSNGDVLPPPPAPAPPKLGPTVSFNPILDGLEAHITDRSGVASQCTYVMDDINRSFGLAANSTFDLRIVPAIPRFRDRNVTITCDNGTKTQATTRF